MWTTFLGTAVLAGALLYFPALPLAGMTGAPWWLVAALSPTLCVLLLVVAGALFAAAGVAASMPLMAGFVLVVSLAASVALWRLGGVRPDLASFRARPRLLAVFAAYVLFGLLVTFFFFKRCFVSPDVFVQIYDNSFHLSVTRSMAASGRFSCFAVSAYLEPSAAAFDPTPGADFYPAAWHIVAALLVNQLQVQVPLAVNALNFVVVAVVVPVGLFSLLCAATDCDLRVLAAGCVLSLAFVAFPWRILYWGPLYSNLFGFSCVAAVVSAFVYAVKNDLAAGLRARVLAAFALSMAALAFMQPNALFTVGVICAPFVGQMLCTRDLPALARLPLPVRGRRALAAALWWAFVALAWVGMYKAPFMRDAVSFSWLPVMGWIEGAVDAATLRLMNYAQPLLAVLVALGVLRTLVDRRYLWMSVSAAACALLYVAAAAGSGTLRHLLTGFWYTDPYRLAAMFAISAAPVAALGLQLASSTLFSLARRAASGTSRPADRLGEKAVYAATALVAAAVVFNIKALPEVSTEGLKEESSEAVKAELGIKNPGPDRGAWNPRYTPFAAVQGALGYMYNIDDADNNLTRKETEFVEKVREVVGDDLVLNKPYDGSAWLYDIYGLNTFYRKYSETGYHKPDGTLDEEPYSVVLRTRADQLASDAEVQQAVEQTGVKYLLLLDYGGGDAAEGGYTPGNYPSQWVGIDAVRDDTPGYELVLKQDDMRLYRLEY